MLKRGQGHASEAMSVLRKIGFERPQAMPLLPRDASGSAKRPCGTAAMVERSGAQEGAPGDAIHAPSGADLLFRGRLWITLSTSGRFPADRVAISDSAFVSGWNRTGAVRLLHEKESCLTLRSETLPAINVRLD